MIRFAVVRVASGEVVRTGGCGEGDLTLQADGVDFIAIEATPEVRGDTHWYDGDSFVAYSQAGAAAKRKQPGFGWAWSPAAEAWVDERPIEGVRTDLLSALKAKRDALLYGGLEWDGSIFDSDAEVSQPRLLGAFTTVLAGGWPPEGVAWRLQDNSWRVLSASDVHAIWAALQTRVMALFAAFGAHEGSVLAETDVNVLRTHDMEAGWP